MKRLTHILAAVTMTGAALTAAAGPASAVTQHCPDFNSPDKVELSYEATSVSGLEPGTEVCYKAGTRVATATIGDDGVLRSTLLNKNGNPMGISYYIPGGGVVLP